MANEAELQVEVQDLKQRLACIESKLINNAYPDSDIVPGRILAPTRHDHHLTLVLLLNEPSGTQAFLDEVIDADSMQEAKEKLTKIQNRKTRYKRKAMILQPQQTWKNYS